MEIVIVRSKEEMENKVAEYGKRGLRVAVCSNTGLPSGTWRLTFLPESAFKKNGVKS